MRMDIFIPYVGDEEEGGMGGGSLGGGGGRELGRSHYFFLMGETIISVTEDEG